jgi:DNA primase
MSKGRITNIDEVKESCNIVDVVGKFVTLKRTGATYTGLCPFHDEKSPSFSVNPAGNYFKCFGCGKGGDSIKFIIEHERKDFIEAIEYLAEQNKIILQREEKEVESQESIDELETMRKMTDWAMQKYWNCFLDAKLTDKAPQYLYDRKLTEETMLQWQIGYAPDDWKFLTKSIIDQGKWKEAQDLGLIKVKTGSNYDTFRNRIIFPIHDQKGYVVGFGGRDISGSSEQKYINSSDSRLYNKSGVLYGLYFAQKSIRHKDFNCAILTEGYLDVITLHQAGVTNAVASSGTSFTETQAKLLKKYTDNVIIMRDGDRAGQKAAVRDIDILLQQGFKVSVFVLPAEHDPDSWVHSLEEEQSSKEFQLIKKGSQNAVLWNVENIMSAAGDDIEDRADAIGTIAHLLAQIEDIFRRNPLIEQIAKKYKIKKADLAQEVKSIIEETENVQIVDEGGSALPAWVNKEHYHTYGFEELIDGDNTGYYFGGIKSVQQYTNFIITPLFHIDSKDDNRRMIQITNGRETKVLELESKKLISLDQFQSAIFDEGFFVCEGGFNRTHLLKIVQKIGRKFPRCHELKELGWQPEGFWAYSNYAFNGELRKFDEMGIVEIHDEKYLSLSVSKIYVNVRAGDDAFENDRFLKYTEPPITFSEWCDLFVKVYGDNAWMGIAFAVMTVFRDIVFRVTKVPHLYAYGAVQAGKSEFGDSISNLFFNQMPAFNLNQGTDFAFFSRMERFRNCPNALNEFDENAIKEEWFRAIKAAYDGEGREKGRGGKAGKTRTQKIHSSIILMGQYLSTKDDSSVLSRCIPLAFRENNNRSDDQIQNFRKLKELEKAGISGTLLELLKLREVVKKEYSNAFSSMQRKLMDQFKAEGKSIKSRILSNIAATMAIIELMSDYITFPFSKDQFYSYGKQLIENVSDMIIQSNSLGGFWRDVEFLLDRSEIMDGVEFKIETVKELSISVDRESSQLKQFDEPRKLLFIRLNVIHTLYSDVFRKKNPKSSAPNMESIRMYLKEQPYWVGSMTSSRFKSKEGKVNNTSCIVLDYEKLSVNLERFTDDGVEDRPEITVSGKLKGSAEKIGDGVTATLVSIKVVSQMPMKHETVYYKLYFASIDEVSNLVEGVNIEVTGLLTEKENKTPNGTFVRRNIDVTSFSVTESVKAESEDVPF